MIGNLICSFLLLYQACFIVRKNSFEKSIIFYLIFAMISPNLNLGGIGISYEILGFPLVLVDYLMSTKRIPIPIDTIGFPLTAYTTLVIIISLIAVVKYSIAIPIVALYAVIRYLLIFQMERGRERSEWVNLVDKVLSVTLFVNVIFSIIQILVSDSVSLFVDLYSKSSNAVLYNIHTMGYFNRAVGTFGSPTLLGPFALISFSFYLSLLFSRDRCNNVYIKIVSSLILGALTLSKTFIIGVPIMTVVILLIVRKHLKKRNILRILFLITVALIIADYGYTFLTQKTAINPKLIEYYFGMISDPFKALQTRYFKAGNLQESVSVFINNPFFGVGLGSIEGEFIGDSAYTKLLHDTGLIGFMLMIIFFTGVIKNYYRNQDRTAFAVLIAALMAGIGIPILTEIMFIIPLGFSLTKLTNQHLKVQETKNCKEDFSEYENNY